MKQSATTVLTPTAETGATAMPGLPAVSLPDERMVDMSALEETCMPLGLEATPLADFLSAAIAHERCGVHLYRSVSARTEMDDLRAAYVEFGDETMRHVEIYTELITEMGGDPQYVSAAARATVKSNTAMLESTFVLNGSADAIVRELSMIEAVGLAETKCHANWMLLEKLAATLPEGPERSALEAAVNEVRPQEDAHLAWAETARETFLANLILPGAQLVQPEAEAAMAPDATAAAAKAPSESPEVDTAAEDAAVEDAEIVDAAAEEAETETADDLVAEREEMTKDELYAMAQERDIPGRSSMTKDQLIAALGDTDQ